MPINLNELVIKSKIILKILIYRTLFLSKIGKTVSDNSFASLRYKINKRIPMLYYYLDIKITGQPTELSPSKKNI